MKTNPVRSTPCAQCPYARSTSKEYLDTRGFNGFRFAAQAHMAALLPCHMDDADGIANPAGKNRQCAGAAIFRTHIDACIPTDILPKLPEDKEAIFANEAELIAHHAGISVQQAAEFLERVPLSYMIEQENLEAARLGAFIPIDD